MNRDTIFEFFHRLVEANPAPETKLEFGNTLQFLVAEVRPALWLIGKGAGQYRMPEVLRIT